MEDAYGESLKSELVRLARQVVERKGDRELIEFLTSRYFA
jgi:hypothetical protein